MRIYLTKILAFSAGLLLINIFAYLYISKPLLYEKYVVPTDTLKQYQSFLFADSHGEAVLKKYLLPYGIYNFSFGSDSYCDIYNKLSFLYDQGIRPDTVFVSVDDHTLSPYREATNNLSRSIHYASQRTYLQYSQGNVVSFYLSKYLVPYLPIFNASNSRLFSDYLLSKLLPPKPADQADSPVAPRPTESPSRGGFSAKQTQDRMKYQFPAGASSQMLANCLEDILFLCQRNQTVLIGIKFPLSAAYLTVLKDKSYHADRFLINEGIEVIDLKYAFVRQNEFFKDPDHVSSQGAKKMSDLLVKKLDTLE